MISRIGHARGRPVLLAAGRWGSITCHSSSVTSVWYRFVLRIRCLRVLGVHMATPGLVSAAAWNHVESGHSTPFEKPLYIMHCGTLGEGIMVHLAEDFAYSDTIKKVLLFIRKHRGRILDFNPEGPGGGNPNILLSFESKEQALRFLQEHSPGDSDEFNLSRIETEDA
jgi:hypothetical protein